MNYIDLSQDINNGMPIYPGDIEVSLKQLNELTKDGYNSFSFLTNLHAGTHVDCPMHLLKETKTIAEYPIENFAGRGVLIDARGVREIGFKREYEEKIKEGDIVLIYTGMDEIYGTQDYYTKHPVIAEELSEFLVHRNIKMLGLDMPSPDFYPFKIHKLLLKNNIFIIENLVNLNKLLKIAGFEIFAQPLKIHAEASLVRAFARYD